MNSETFLKDLPLVAILRGVTPERILKVADTLYGAGLRAIEVPLNSPRPFDSIALLAKEFGDRCLVGAGTVLDVADTDRVADAGGRLVVTPNTDPAVIQCALRREMVVMPGFFSPTEALAALAAGARTLKLFPAASAGTGHLKAVLAVLPPSVPVFAVGGVDAADMGEWKKAGALGFGLGSGLFKATFTDDEIAERAARCVAAFRAP
jgi:2-dehydro-3-deoxyphosphogalactonate aldolase